MRRLYVVVELKTDLPQELTAAMIQKAVLEVDIDLDDERIDEIMGRTVDYTNCARVVRVTEGPDR